MASNGDKNLTLEISVFVRKEGEQYASWCPELDIASCGDSIEDACIALDDAIDVYLDSIIKEGEILKILEERGFKQTGDKVICEAPFLSSRHKAVTIPA